MPAVKDILGDSSVTACRPAEIAKFIELASFMRIDLDLTWRTFAETQQQILLDDLKAILRQTFKPEIKPSTAWPKYTMINGVSHELNSVYLAQQPQLLQNVAFISRHNLAYRLTFYGAEYGSPGKRTSIQDSLLLNALHFVEFFTLLIALVRGFDVVHERCGLAENTKEIFDGISQTNSAIYLKLILADEHSLPIGYDPNATYDLLFTRFGDTFFSVPNTTELYWTNRKTDHTGEYEYCMFAEYNRLFPRKIGVTLITDTQHAQQNFLDLLQTKCRDNILRDNLLLWIQTWQHHTSHTEQAVRRKFSLSQP
jgi:hypothetical protein